MGSQSSRRELRRSITIQHPLLTAWADFSEGMRISLRHIPVTVTNGGRDESKAVIVLSPALTSGPFFDGADSQ